MRLNNNKHYTECLRTRNGSLENETMTPLLVADYYERVTVNCDCGIKFEFPKNYGNSVKCSVCGLRYFKEEYEKAVQEARSKGETVTRRR